MVHIQSELVRLLMRIGYAAAWQGLHKEAVAIFEGVGAVRPESEVPIIGASVVAMIAGNHDVAVQVLKEGALDLNPDSDLARVHLGVALRLRGDEEEGLALLREVASNATDPESATLAGNVLQLPVEQLQPSLQSL
jgi:tetratricopeptide (TPR) repeat protein